MAKRMSITPRLPEPPDPMMERFGLYEEDGKIRFIKHIPNYYGTRRTQRWYTYYTGKRELWRTYVRTKRDWKRIPSYYAPEGYVRTNRLEPVWPKHMMVDKGL